MRTPAKGDYDERAAERARARQVADTWEPSMDGRCEAYGVGGLMRMPRPAAHQLAGRHTLKIETDAGQQTRLLRFARARRAGRRSSAAGTARTLQGTSVAEWQRSGGAFDAFLERGGGAGGRHSGGAR